LLLGERRDFELVEDDDAGNVIVSTHGHAKFRTDGVDVAPRVAVLWVRPQVDDVDRPSLERDSGRDGVSSWSYGVLPDELDKLRGRVVERNPLIAVAGAPEDDAPPRATQAGCVLDERVEHRLEVER
jgi:hypothetical protein